MRCLILFFLGSAAQGFLRTPLKEFAVRKQYSKDAPINIDDNGLFPKRTRQRLQIASKEAPTSSFKLPNRSRRTKHKDAVIIGAGLAGLSVAIYLSQLDPDRRITVVDKQDPDVESKKKTTIASFAAAGMLAPQSERLPKGHLLDICLASRRMYPEFCDLVESMAKESGEEGAKYLLHNKDDPTMRPWNVGYMASGGFLAPAFAGDSVATWSPPDDGGSATWLDEIQVRELEPNLHEDVVGGWWFPEDASVDARRLTCSLYAACVGAGIEFQCGEKYEVTSLDLTDGECHGLWLKNGNYLKAKSVLVANGAWMRNLLPVPVEPHKGQSLALTMPKDRPPILRRVLFAQDCYIVPKEDGKIVVGATVEAGSFDGDVTPAGLLHILTHALHLVPGLKDLPILETWAGLRPTTPDKGPILGKSPWKNLFLAGGYWRNGVLLAPKTAQLIACLMSGTELTQGDQELLHAFSWDRFTDEGGGAKLAANARYAASMHPIQSRKSGTGVAAAVGTELGSYSTATKSKDERARDRSTLWGDDDGDESFERAAALGTRDATAFNFGDDDDDDVAVSDSEKNQEEIQEVEMATDSEETSALSTEGFSGSGDSASDSSQSSEIASVYQSIKENKEKRGMELPEASNENKPDPGFRIYHVDSNTGESREVPPYTAPGDFLESIGKSEVEPEETVSASPNADDSSVNNIDAYNAESQSEPGYNEKTYDGYQVIQEANEGKTRDGQLESMRKARIKNRLGQSDIDESAIGAQNADDVSRHLDANGQREKHDEGAEEGASSTSDIMSTYQTIRDNKAKQKQSLPEDNLNNEKEDPGFRIYHIDSTTGESREVPPYTAPGDFLQSIGKQKDEEQPNEEGDDINGGKQSMNEATVKHNGVNGDDATNGDIGYNEKTYDGYQVIQEANSSENRGEELEKMRQIRQKNRLGQSGIDESKLGS